MGNPFSKTVPALPVQIFEEEQSDPEIAVQEPPQEAKKISPTDASKGENENPSPNPSLDSVEIHIESISDWSDEEPDDGTPDKNESKQNISPRSMRKGHNLSQDSHQRSAQMEQDEDADWIAKPTMNRGAPKRMKTKDTEVEDREFVLASPLYNAQTPGEKARAKKRPLSNADYDPPRKKTARSNTSTSSEVEILAVERTPGSDRTGMYGRLRKRSKKISYIEEPSSPFKRKSGSKVVNTPARKNTRRS